MPSSLLKPWNDCSLHAEEIRRLQFDRLSLTVSHTGRECLLEYNLARDQRGWLVYDQIQAVRFLISSGQRQVTVVPRLADRAVVSRPLVSTNLLPRESTTLMVGTPLWAEIRIGDRILAELPTARLSDTWFGADTRSGELCYASQTRARLSLDAVNERSPFRAVTAVTVVNRGDDNLRLDRINVPVPYLTLFCDGQRFRTSSLRIVRERDLTTAKLDIDDKPPISERPMEHVAPPRTLVRGGVFNKAIDLLFA